MGCRLCQNIHHTEFGDIAKHEAFSICMRVFIDKSYLYLTKMHEGIWVALNPCRVKICHLKV